MVNTSSRKPGKMYSSSLLDEEMQFTESKQKYKRNTISERLLLIKILSRNECQLIHQLRIYRSGFDIVTLIMFTSNPVFRLSLRGLIFIPFNTIISYQSSHHHVIHAIVVATCSTTFIALTPQLIVGHLSFSCPL